MIFTILMSVSFILALVFWTLGVAKDNKLSIIFAVILIGFSGVCSWMSNEYPKANEITPEIVENKNAN